MSERSYRIRTDITKDKVVRVKTEQDYASSCFIFNDNISRKS